MDIFILLVQPNNSDSKNVTIMGVYDTYEKAELISQELVSSGKWLSDELQIIPQNVQ